eukprot:Gregarina_sp_Poly_1__1429@NODE_1357_length_4305_cov_171_765691_g13_i1_p1_GENE_NODE_1357_length_4305_cov_171_765691_g13_i1NODE_1357_length_4305_cov_171_765691_g13_i1_p1_ORF_typecomplete_len534_score104_58PEARLI4/PF05278_12/0_059DUF3311/PF11755_8/0_63_NODE_1357_length_4305_cov_171_765691_g13_i122433844
MLEFPPSDELMSTEPSDQISPENAPHLEPEQIVENETNETAEIAQHSPYVPVPPGYFIIHHEEPAPVPAEGPELVLAADQGINMEDVTQAASNASRPQQEVPDAAVQIPISHSNQGAIHGGGSVMATAVPVTVGYGSNSYSQITQNVQFSHRGSIEEEAGANQMMTDFEYALSTYDEPTLDPEHVPRTERVSIFTRSSSTPETNEAGGRQLQQIEDAPENGEGLLMNSTTEAQEIASTTTAPPPIVVEATTTPDSTATSSEQEQSPVPVVVNPPVVNTFLPPYNYDLPTLFGLPFFGGVTPFLPQPGPQIVGPPIEIEWTIEKEEEGDTEEETTVLAPAAIETTEKPTNPPAAIQAVTAEPALDTELEWNLTPIQPIDWEVYSAPPVSPFDVEEIRFIQEDNHVDELSTKQPVPTRPELRDSLLNSVFDFFGFVLEDLQSAMNRVIGFMRPAVEHVREGLIKIEMSMDATTSMESEIDMNDKKTATAETEASIAETEDLIAETEASTAETETTIAEAETEVLETETAVADGEE